MASIFLNLDTQLINIYGLLAKGLRCWSIRPDFPDLIVRGISMAELVFDLSEVNDKHHRGLKYSFHEHVASSLEKVPNREIQL